jgi:hypothetical protein
MQHKHPGTTRKQALDEILLAGMSRMQALDRDPLGRYSRHVVLGNICAIPVEHKHRHLQQAPTSVATSPVLRSPPLPATAPRR